MRRAALALAAGLGLAGCGVGAQPEPEEVRVPGPASPEAGAPGDAAGTGLRVWFVRGSLLEAAELAGLRTRDLITRFLPYSTKGRLPSHPLLVRAYLQCRPAWWLLGRQTLYVGERAS